jgi:hypothetical protein
MRKKSSRKKSNKKKFSKPIDWDDIPAKKQAFLDIMHNIVQNPSLGDTYLGSDDEAANAFRAAGMNVPPGVKVVFVPAGDSNKVGGGSAVIELPPTRSTKAATSDEQLLELFLCTYNIW